MGRLIASLCSYTAIERVWLCLLAGEDSRRGGLRFGGGCAPSVCVCVCVILCIETCSPLEDRRRIRHTNTLITLTLLPSNPPSPRSYESIRKLPTYIFTSLSQNPLQRVVS